MGRKAVTSRDVPASSRGGDARPAEAALERVRAICLGFPGAEEKLSHGAPSFHVRGKMFLMFVDDHHADGRLAVWCKAALEEQCSLVAAEPARFFVPPYVGVKGWVGVVLDAEGRDREPDWIALAILVEAGWLSVAPKRLAAGERSAAPVVRPPPPKRLVTDAAVARAALERATRIALALPEATCEREARHAAFRVRKKVFAYFLDNHHGDGIVGVCVRTPKTQHARTIASDPKRFYVPAYIGAKGWIGIRVDAKRVPWDDVAERIDASFRAVAPKRLVAAR
jgi:hypothetical protein